MNTQANTARAAGNGALESGIASLRDSISHHLVYTVGKDAVAASQRDWLYALSMAGHFVSDAIAPFIVYSQV